MLPTATALFSRRCSEKCPEKICWPDKSPFLKVHQPQNAIWQISVNFLSSHVESVRRVFKSFKWRYALGNSLLPSPCKCDKGTKRLWKKSCNQSLTEMGSKGRPASSGFYYMWIRCSSHEITPRPIHTCVSCPGQSALTTFPTTHYINTTLFSDIIISGMGNVIFTLYHRVIEIWQRYFLISRFCEIANYYTMIYSNFKYMIMFQ